MVPLFTGQGKVKQCKISSVHSAKDKLAFSLCLCCFIALFQLSFAVSWCILYNLPEWNAAYDGHCKSDWLKQNLTSQACRNMIGLDHCHNVEYRQQRNPVDLIWRQWNKRQRHFLFPNWQNSKRFRASLIQPSLVCPADPPSGGEQPERWRGQKRNKTTFDFLFLIFDNVQCQVEPNKKEKENSTSVLNNCAAFET